MATSSIFTNVRIDTPQRVDSFLSACEASLEDSKRKREVSKKSVMFITDKKTIKSFVAKVCKK